MNTAGVRGGLLQGRQLVRGLRGARGGDGRVPGGGGSRNGHLHRVLNRPIGAGHGHPAKSERITALGLEES